MVWVSQGVPWDKHMDQRRRSFATCLLFLSFSSCTIPALACVLLPPNGGGIVNVIFGIAWSSADLALVYYSEALGLAIALLVLTDFIARDVRIVTCHPKIKISSLVVCILLCST